MTMGVAEAILAGPTLAAPTVARLLLLGICMGNQAGIDGAFDVSEKHSLAFGKPSKHPSREI